MCAIMGLADVRNVFSASDRSCIMRRLAVVSESRGTDATGFAYNHRGYLNIFKNPLPAHKMKLRLSEGANVIIGHTRMTTQGQAARNYNNHPFMGMARHTRFALVHNGIISNERALRGKFNLRDPKIETDSYIAVQLIEHKHRLDFDSLKFMAEQLSGIFTFAILDNRNNVWIVKGDNPVCIYYSTDYGFYIFASTEEILSATLRTLELDKLRYEKIQMTDGEMLKISSGGAVERGTFEMDGIGSYGRFGYCRWLDDDDWEICMEAESKEVEQLKQSAVLFGVSEDEVELLLESGYCPDEIEMLLNSPRELQLAICGAAFE